MVAVNNCANSVIVTYTGSAGTGGNSNTVFNWTFGANDYVVTNLGGVPQGALIK